MKMRPYLLHALSPLHAGTGQAVDIIDLPIARMASTGIPIVPGSSIKGVLRDARRGSLAPGLLEAVFGPEKDRSGDDAHAGALTVSDARLLALPVRSFKGVFAWVTSPLLLSLARRDLAGTGAVGDSVVPASEPSFNERGAALAARSINGHQGRLYLQDLDLPIESAQADQASAWAAHLALWAFGEDAQVLTRRFAVVDDDTMAFLWETATQVDARVTIDHTTRTAADGQLWYEESLPPESLLIGLLAATRSFSSQDTSAVVLDAALKGEETLQFGGKATVGRGRCRAIPKPDPAEA